jgi:hypothetical protein
MPNDFSKREKKIKLKTKNKQEIHALTKVKHF